IRGKMMSARYRLLWVVGLSFLCLGSLPAGTQVSASLSGRVTDQTGAVVSGASVTAENLDTGMTRSTLTDQAGRYELIALPIGQYDIRARKAGFAERVRTGISLVVGQDATVDLSLPVGNVSEQVTVS